MSSVCPLYVLIHVRLQAPISEEDYLARKGVEKEKKPMAEEERTMINQVRDMSDSHIHMCD